MRNLLVFGFCLLLLGCAADNALNESIEVEEELANVSAELEETPVVEPEIVDIEQDVEVVENSTLPEEVAPIENVSEEVVPVENVSEVPAPVVQEVPVMNLSKTPGFEIYFPTEGFRVRGNLIALSLVLDNFTIGAPNTTHKDNYGYFLVYVDNSAPLTMTKSVLTLKELSASNHTVKIDMVRNDGLSYGVSRTVHFEAQSVTAKS